MMTNESPVMSVQRLRDQKAAIDGELQMHQQNAMRCSGALALIEGLIQQAEKMVIEANVAAHKAACVVVEDQAAS